MSSTLVKAHLKRHSLLKRMLPLYIGNLLQWSVFWYAIEKLFLLKIGLNTEEVSLCIAIYSATALIMEIPSGILADRWSRKGTLVLGNICLIIGTTIAAISTNVNMYLVSSVFWGMYIAMNSGTFEAIIYDLLIEEDGDAKNYEKAFSRLDIFCSIGLILGSLGGGIIGQYVGLKEAYLLSIPAVILSTVFFWSFKEPSFHKIEQDKSLLGHIKTTLGSVFQKKQLTQLLIAIISVSLIWLIMSDINQLWLAALFTPIILYGPVQALSSCTFGIGSTLARFIKSKRRIVESMVVALICLFLIIFIHNMWVNIIAEFIALLITYGVSVVLTHQLHDNLPSKVRASSGSTIGAIKRLLTIPVILLFGAIATSSDVFNAGWILVIILVIAIVARILMKPIPKMETKNV